MYMRHNSIVWAVIGERLGVCRPIAPAGHQGDCGGDLSDSGGSSAHGRGCARGLRPSWWTTALYLPCWDWRGHRDLWSVKHGRAGMNDPDPGSCPMEGSCGPRGPYPGPMHDVAAPGAFRAAGGGMDPSGWIGDKGHVGRGMITPHKKPPTANRARRPRRRTGASTRSAGWSSGPSPTSSPGESTRTAYRRSLETFEQTITAALALYSFKTTP